MIWRKINNILKLNSVDYLMVCGYEKDNGALAVEMEKARERMFETVSLNP